MVIKEWRRGSILSKYWKAEQHVYKYLYLRIVLYLAVATKDSFSSRHVQLILNLPGFDPAGSTLKFWNFTLTLKPLGTVILYRQLDLPG